MIAKLTGTLSHKSSGSAVVDVHGVGFLVYTTPQNLLVWSTGAPCSFFTYLAVRDDALDLYGFADETELAFFKKLLTLPGIGPKSALGILSSASIDALAQSITEQDPDYLSKMSGIGKKSAEKIVLGLKDKIDGIVSTPQAPRLREEADIVEAIAALGYSLHDAREAVKKIPEEISGENNRIKAALKALGTR